MLLGFQSPTNKVCTYKQHKIAQKLYSTNLQKTLTILRMNTIYKQLITVFVSTISYRYIYHSVFARGGLKEMSGAQQEPDTEYILYAKPLCRSWSLPAHCRTKESPQRVCIAKARPVVCPPLLILAS